jgi:hypothetical protein
MANASVHILFILGAAVTPSTMNDINMSEEPVPKVRRTYDRYGKSVKGPNQADIDFGSILLLRGKLFAVTHHLRSFVPAVHALQPHRPVFSLSPRYLELDHQLAPAAIIEVPSAVPLPVSFSATYSLH